MPLMADPSLSRRVRADTRVDHAAAQASGFLDALAAGRLPRDAYADLATQHHFIYRALERAAARMAGSPFVSDELTRLPAIEADLRFLYGPQWRGRITPLPATERYVARLHAVTSGEPAFVAHHYSRYLGDLSGGQFLGPAIAEAYGLSGDGHRFFVFEGVDPPAFRARYRTLLDEAPWSRAEQDAFLTEVSQAYRLNIDVLDELTERWI
jgi:heme oxygenase (biliverdin-producing, ferredoxin)